MITPNYAFTVCLCSYNELLQGLKHLVLGFGGVSFFKKSCNFYDFALNNQFGFGVSLHWDIVYL